MYISKTWFLSDSILQKEFSYVWTDVLFCHLSVLLNSPSGHWFSCFYGSCPETIELCSTEQLKLLSVNSINDTWVSWHSHWLPSRWRNSVCTLHFYVCKWGERSFYRSLSWPIQLRKGEGAALLLLCTRTSAASAGRAGAGPGCSKGGTYPGKTFKWAPKNSAIQYF